MAMCALDSRNRRWGPCWGPNSGTWSASAARRRPFHSVVGDVVAASDDRLGWLSPFLRRMAGPPEMLGHHLGPHGGAERLVGGQRLARLAIPPGARRRVRFRQRCGESRMLDRPCIEVGQ